MGIKINKAHATLSEYNVIGQEIALGSFKTLNRSVNKSLLSYQWPEKANLIYQFDYMSEANYRTLSYLLRNRSSLHEGLITLPIPYSDDSSYCDLDFTSITNPSATHKAYYIDNASRPALTDFVTEFSTANYQAIDDYDSNSFDQGGISNTGYLRFSFLLTNFINNFSSAEIRRLTFCFWGMKASPIKFYIWDDTNSEWYNIRDAYYYDDTQFSEAGFYNYYQMVAAFTLPWGYDNLDTNFIDGSNYCHFMVEFPETENIFCQYARLFVNGYHVISEDPEQFDYANSFTGAGRRGTLKLLEI